PMRPRVSVTKTVYPRWAIKSVARTAHRLTSLSAVADNSRFPKVRVASGPVRRSPASVSSVSESCCEEIISELHIARYRIRQRELDGQTLLEVVSHPERIGDDRQRRVHRAD